MPGVDPAFARSFTQLPYAVRALYGINRVYARAFHRVRILRPCPVPSTGGGIVVANHTAGLDPFILQATFPRFITWMMAKEFWELPVLQRINQQLGYIPVARSGRDSTSLKMALRALESGRMLGVFPEGRIARTRQLLPFQPGVAMMAGRAGVPIYPAYLSGMQLNIGTIRALFDPQDVAVLYGDPITVGRDLTEANATLSRAMAALREQSLARRLPH